MGFTEEMNVLSEQCRNYIRAGQISMYSNTLKEMAQLLSQYGRVNDQLKMLITAFYIDLSGFGQTSYIDCKLVEQIQLVIASNFMDVDQLEIMYFNWIQPDMISQHTMSVKDSWYLMRLCIEGKTEHANYILSKF